MGWIIPEKSVKYFPEIQSFWVQQSKILNSAYSLENRKCSKSF